MIKERMFVKPGKEWRNKDHQPLIGGVIGIDYLRGIALIRWNDNQEYWTAIDAVEVVED